MSLNHLIRAVALALALGFLILLVTILIGQALGLSTSTSAHLQDFLAIGVCLTVFVSFCLMGYMLICHNLDPDHQRGAPTEYAVVVFFPVLTITLATEHQIPTELIILGLLLMFVYFIYWAQIIREKAKSRLSPRDH